MQMRKVDLPGRWETEQRGWLCGEQGAQRGCGSQGLIPKGLGFPPGESCTRGWGEGDLTCLDVSLYPSAVLENEQC